MVPLCYLIVDFKTVSLVYDSLSWLMPGNSSKTLRQTCVPPASWISVLMTAHFDSMIIFHLHKLFTTIWLCSTITQGSCIQSWLTGAFNLYSFKIIIIYGFCLQLFQVIISKWFSSLQNPLLLSHHCPQQNLKDKSIFSAIYSIHSTLFMWICIWSFSYCFLQYLKWH